MIRNLKVLGLALTAMFAFAAISASAASAQGTLTTAAPTTLTGVETGAKSGNQLTAFGVGITCESTYKGHKYKVTPHENIPNGATTATITPTYKNCHVAGTTFKVTVDMNGCDYVLHLGATTNAALDEYAVTADLVCDEGKDITVTVFWDEHDHLVTNKPFCVLHIKPQVGLKGAELRDTTNGTLDLTGAVEGIHIVGTDTTAHALFCPVAGDEQTVTNGKLDLDVSITGSAAGLKLSHP